MAKIKTNNSGSLASLRFASKQLVDLLASALRTEVSHQFDQGGLADEDVVGHDILLDTVEAFAGGTKDYGWNPGLTQNARIGPEGHRRAAGGSADSFHCFSRSEARGWSGGVS